MNWEGRGKRISEAHWPARLANQRAPEFSADPPDINLWLSYMGMLSRTPLN